MMFVESNTDYFIDFSDEQYILMDPCFIFHWLLRWTINALFDYTDYFIDFSEQEMHFT